VSCKSWNLTMCVGLLSCITTGGALAGGDHWTRLLQSGECVGEFRFQKRIHQAIRDHLSCYAKESCIFFRKWRSISKPWPRIQRRNG
jgi:hypothetical protein